MSQLGSIRKNVWAKCYGRIFYPHVKFRSKCLGTFKTTSHGVLFCIKCRYVASQHKQRGDYGIEHEMNPLNQPEPTFRVCAWHECNETFIPGNHHRRYHSKSCQRRGTKADVSRREENESKVPLRSKKHVHSPKTLQWVSADKLPEAINRILDQFHR